MEEAVDLVNLYEVERLPKELANQVEVIQRCAELTAEAMPRLQAMKNLEEYWIEINRLENAGDKSYRRILAKLFSGKYDALEVLKLKDIVDSLEEAIDAFEKVANIVEQIARQGVLTVDLAIVIAVVAGRPGVRLHQRLPRRGQRDRDLGLDACAHPADRAGPRRGDELRRRAPRPGGRATRSAEVIQPPSGNARPGRRAGRPGRRDHLEPDHLVLRPALVVLARPDRRPGRLGAGRRARSCTGPRSWTRS